MKLSTCVIALGLAGIAFAPMAEAGPEALPSGGEAKTIESVAPQPCNWQGFYVGLNGGGQFGRTRDADLDGYNFIANPGGSWRYGESGFSGGGEMGYNWQWHWLVLGPEIDGGYMNIRGRHVQPGSPGDDTVGQSDSDFFTTFRGRLGIAFDKWLVYGTGGGIGLNVTNRVVDSSVTPPAGPSVIDAQKTEFDWGYAVGGGVERMIGCHWSIKAEYLYFDTGSQAFSGSSTSLVAPGAVTFHWRGETTGNIVRAGLNFKF